MNTSFKFTLMFVLICTFFSIGQQVCYGMDKVSEDRAQINKQYDAYKQRAVVMPNIDKRILENTFEPARIPPGPLSQNLIRIREKANELATSEEIKPQQVEVLRTDLNRAIEGARNDNERAEYEKIGESLDIVQSIAELKDRERVLNDIVQKSDSNYEDLNVQKKQASLWKKIFSGGFTVSFVANMVALLGFLTKMPSAKLDRQLKELQIAEKRASLEKAGIDYKNYIE